MHAARGSALLRVLAIGASTATSVLLARALGPQSYGTYAYVFAIITFLALPAQVGIPTLLVRETAKAQAHEDWPRLKGLWAWSNRTILITSGVIAATAAVLLLMSGARTDEAFRWTLLSGLLLVPLIALGNARGAALIGLRLIVRGQLPESVLRPVFLVLFVWLAWSLSGPVTAQAAMAWHVVGATAAFLIGGMLLWFAQPPQLATVASDTSHAPEWRRAALPMALIAGLQVLGDQSGLILLGIFRSPIEVAQYKVATSAAMLALFGLQTVALIIAPHIARQHALGDPLMLQRLASLAVVVSVVLTAPAFLIFAFAGRWVITLLYGEAYVDAYVPLLILASGQIVNTFFGLNAALLSMTGHERDAARWLMVSAGIAVIVGSLLIPSMGVSGAAAAHAVAMTVWNLAFWRIVRKKVGVDSSLICVMRFGSLGGIRGR